MYIKKIEGSHNQVNTIAAIVYISIGTYIYASIDVMLFFIIICRDITSPQIYGQIVCVMRKRNKIIDFIHSAVHGRYTMINYQHIV